MNDMNEVHRSLGQIESNVTSLMQTVREVRDYQIKMNGAIGKAHVRIDQMEPHVKDYTETKKKAIIGLLSLGGLTGLIGGKIGAFFSGLLG